MQLTIIVGVGLANRLNRPTTLHRGSSPKFTTFLVSRKRISFHSSPHATALKFMRGLEWNGEN